jgi:hypothetical protein
MSGNAVHIGRLIALWLLAAVLASAGWISIPAASAGQAKTPRPPTLLWKSYPLKQRPNATEQAQAGLGSLQAASQRSPESKQLQNALLVSLLLATLVTMAAIVLMRSSLPVRVGGLRRAGDGVRTRGPARRPRGAKPPRTARQPPPVREVTGQPVAEPHAPPTQPAVPEPGADLLEALHPKPPSPPELEPVPEQAVIEQPHRAPTPKHQGDSPVEQHRTMQPKPAQTRNPPLERREWEPERERTREPPLELQLRKLVERMQTAPASGREQLEREIDLLHGQIKARPPSPRELERRREQELRKYINEVHAVPEPDRTGEARVEPPPQPPQTGASVESCEIKLWRGYVKCQLYATLRGSEEALAVSGYFRLRDQEAPSPSAQHALNDLLADLEQAGWTVVSVGAIWYQQQLQRFAP